MAIWLYYTKKGNLAKIQHGENLRQGSSFKIIYAFEDKDIILNKSLTVAFKKPGGEVTPFFPVGKFTEQDLLSSASRIRFNKIKNTEMTYGLQDNVEYYCLTGTYDPTITEKYGTLTVITKISTQVGQLDGIDEDRDGEIDNEEQDDTVYFQGSVQLYVEPTYGKQPESSNISLDQYNSLIECINDVAANKVNTGDGLVNNLTITGKLNATGETLDSSLPNGLYVNDPTHDKHVTNKIYVDTQTKELDDKINEVKSGLDNKVDEVNGEAEGLKLKGTTFANFENSIILVNTPGDTGDSRQVINREYADTKVSQERGTAKDLTLKGRILANGQETYMEINDPIFDNHPVNKRFLNNEINKVNDKIGNLNELESIGDLEKVDIVNAINNATTKNEVAELLLKYVFADDADDDFSPIEEVNLTYVYKAEKAINDENGDNIAQSISELRKNIVPSITEENVVNLIANHNNFTGAHDNIITPINESISSLNSSLNSNVASLNTRIDNAVSDLNQKISDDISTAINGLIDGADGAYDTLKDIEKELKENDSSITEILTSLSKKATTDQLKAVEDKIPTGAAADYNVATSITGSDNLATDKAIKEFVENKKYLTGINSNQVTTALGFTPYNATNPNGYITASADITGTAANATKLNNQDASYYATKEDIKDFVKVTVQDDVLIIS